MTNQDILDNIEFNLPSLPIALREEILSAVWDVLSDNRSENGETE